MEVGFQDRARRQPIHPMIETIGYDLSRDIRELIDKADNNRVSFCTLSSSTANTVSSTESSRRIFETAGRSSDVHERAYPTPGLGNRA
jgi:hypothetical protein